MTLWPNSLPGEGVARGVTVVAVTTLVIRLLGALYRPVVVHLFKAYDGADGLAGLGLAQAPAAAYTIILSFTSIGFNVALARLVADARAREDMDGAREIFRASLLIMGVLGLAGGLVLAVGAPWLERASNMPGSSIGYLATAPALIIISVVAAFRGLFQGLGAMTPNANSQLLEAVPRNGAGIALVAWLAPMSVPYGAAGFNLGDAVGAFVSLGYLIWLYRSNREMIWQGGLAPHPARKRRRKREVAATLARNALPIALIGAALPLMMYLDAFIVGHGLPRASAVAVYGELTAGFALIMLPTVVTGSLASALIPALAGAAARHDDARAQNLAASAYRLTLLTGLPAAVGLATVGSGIFRLLYGTTQGAQFMWILALGVLPIMLQQTSSTVLQGIGRLAEPVLNLGIGTVVKLVASMLLVARFGGYGVAWGTAIGFGVSATLNIRSVAREARVPTAWIGQAVRPAAAAVAMGVGVWLMSHFALPLVHSRSVLALVVMAEVGAGALIYAVALLLLRAVGPNDVSRVPWLGPRLARRLGGAES